MSKLHRSRILILFVVFMMSSMGSLYGGVPEVDKYNVEWTEPGADATDSMPIGNGNIAANVYVVEDDALYLLLSKNDALNRDGDLYKTGRVRIELDPNPFTADQSFHQELQLETGSVRIQAGDVDIRIWTDAHHPVYRVQVDAPEPVRVTAEPEYWQRYRLDIMGKRIEKQEVERDTEVLREDRIVWYHTNGEHSTYRSDLKFQGISHMADKHPDPYKYNTFGAMMTSPSLSREKDQLTGTSRSTDLRIYSISRQVEDPEQWIEEIDEVSENVLTGKNWSSHKEWWRQFWTKSWVTASDHTIPEAQREKPYPRKNPGTLGEKDEGYLVASGYNLSRYLMACQSRGQVPVKFNGGLFTVPGVRHQDRRWHADERLWGGRFTFKNQRHMYWPLLKSGDGNLMNPFFQYHRSVLDLRTAFTREWFGHEGAFYRENTSLTGKFWGSERHLLPPREPDSDGSWTRNYHAYLFTPSLELLHMMIRHYQYTGDDSFRTNTLLPVAEEVLTFFDQHYERDDNGHLHLKPGQALETYWKAENPTPDIAGLRVVVKGLLSLDKLPGDVKSLSKKLEKDLPPVPLSDDEPPRVLYAENWSMKNNRENPALYAVFPFQLFGLGRGRKNLNIARETYRHRKNKWHRCWSSNDIQAAYCGLVDEAKRQVVGRFRDAVSEQLRFPVFHKERPDYLPDFDGLGAGMSAVQSMLLQSTNGKLIVLPSWPDSWDARFKLHAPGETIVKGTVRNGELKRLKVSPDARRDEVVLGQGWTLPGSDSK